MKLQTIPLGTTLLSSNLKVGLLAGIVGVAASTGAAATSTNSSTLSSAFDSIYGPIKSFFSSNIDPHFKKVYEGAEKIGGQLKSWAESAYGKKDSVLTWIKNNFSSSTVKSGFSKIVDKTKSWADSGKTILSSTYSTGKTTVLPFLSNSESMRNLLYHGSEITNILKAFATLLTASALSSATGGASGEGSTDEDGEEEGDETASNVPPLSRFWQLVSHEKFGEIISSVWDLVTKNLNIVKQLARTDVNKIVDFVLSEPEQVKPRIDAMKTKTEKNGTSSKWGSYANSSEFMNALFPPELIVKAVMEALKTLAGEDMTQYLTNTETTIPNDTVKKILDCKLKSDGDVDSSKTTCPESATITTVLTELLKSILPVTAPETQLQSS